VIYNINDNSYQISDLRKNRIVGSRKEPFHNLSFSVIIIFYIILLLKESSSMD